MLHPPTGFPNRKNTTQFQWAPTLGGECYVYARRFTALTLFWFQWAPTLGGECYSILEVPMTASYSYPVSMGTHPWG